MTVCKTVALRLNKFESYHSHQERVRLVEGAVLKTVGLNRSGGSIPSLSASITGELTEW